MSARSTASLPDLLRACATDETKRRTQEVLPESGFYADRGFAAYVMEK